jgi:hypothetical protein
VKKILLSISFFRKEEGKYQYHISEDNSAQIKHRTAKASPTIFSSGDLVEALVSFVMIPVGRQYTLKPILRGLVMLDNTERGVSKSKPPLKYF